MPQSNLRSAFVSCWSTPLWDYGWAFVGIGLGLGLGIAARTLIGHFFAGDWFDLWMAVVDGGGLIMGGWWMRRS